MMANFMSDHVSLGKIAWSLEAVAQLTIEIEIDINLVIFRAIEWPGRSLRRPARRLHRAAKEHQFRGLIGAAVARENFPPGTLCAPEHPGNEIFHLIIAACGRLARCGRRVRIDAGT